MEDRKQNSDLDIEKEGYPTPSEAPAKLLSSETAMPAPSSEGQNVRGIPRETIRLLHGMESGTGIRLYYCGSESCTPGHFFGPAVRPHYLIHFIRNGRGTYLRKGEVHELKKGDAFLILPGETTKYMADEKEPWDYTWVAFDGAGAEALLRCCSFSVENVIFHAQNEDRRTRLIRQATAFESCFQDESGNLLEVLGQFYLLFSCMYQEEAGSELRQFAWGNEENRTGGSDYSAEKEGIQQLTGQVLYFRQAEEYLKHNFSYPVKVEQLARYIGVSRSYLYKTFMACCQKSVQQYLIDLRLREACTLLAETNREITDIAYSCGFTDSPSFCRQFRQAYSQTPLQFRRRMCASSPSQPSHTSR